MTCKLCSNDIDIVLCVEIKKLDPFGAALWGGPSKQRSAYCHEHADIVTSQIDAAQEKPAAQPDEVKDGV